MITAPLSRTVFLSNGMTLGKTWQEERGDAAEKKQILMGQWTGEDEWDSKIEAHTKGQKVSNHWPHTEGNRAQYMSSDAECLFLRGCGHCAQKLRIFNLNRSERTLHWYRSSLR